MAAPTVILTADNEFLANRLLANASVLSRFQYLRTTLADINNLRATCGTCSGKKSQAEQDIRKKWSDIRQYLLTLSAEDRQFIKDQAQIKPNQRVRISYQVGSGASSRFAKEFF